MGYLSYDFIKDEFSKNGLVLLEEEYKNYKTRMLCKDAFGYIGYLSYNSLKLGSSFYPFSKENNFAMENLKLFITEKYNNVKIMFDEFPQHNQNVPFKCSCGNIFYTKLEYILNKKVYRNLLIEVDGEGHFYPVQYNNMDELTAIEHFNKIKINDAIKNEYCSKNNIKLIRIPYYDFKNKIYIKTLKDNLLERK